MPKNQPHPIREREQRLIRLYSYCQLEMTPQRFYAKWDVDRGAISDICSRSVTTVHCWFSKGKNYRRPTPTDLRHLALMDFLLEHYEEIPEQLRNLLCPADETENIG